MARAIQASLDDARRQQEQSAAAAGGSGAQPAAAATGGGEADAAGGGAAGGGAAAGLDPGRPSDADIIKWENEIKCAGARDAREGRLLLLLLLLPWLCCGTTRLAGTTAAEPVQRRWP